MNKAFFKIDNPFTARAKQAKSERISHSELTANAKLHHTPLYTSLQYKRAFEILERG